MGKTMDTSSFGEWLKKARAAKGMNSTDLAAATGVSQPAITGYENGTRRPKRPTAIALAHALGLPESEVLLAAGFVPNSMDLDMSTEFAALPEFRKRIIHDMIQSWKRDESTVAQSVSR